MATVVGDAFSDTSRFHTMMGAVQHQHSHDSHFATRSASRSREHDAPARHRRPSQSPRRQSSSASAATRHAGPQVSAAAWGPSSTDPRDKASETKQTPGSGGASRFPSPPSSSSPSDTASNRAQPQHGTPAYMASGDVASQTAGIVPSVASESSASSTSTATTVVPAPSRSMPSPEEPRWGAATETLASNNFAAQPGDPSSALHHLESHPPAESHQTAIRIRDIAHIQSLARDDMLSPNGPGILNDPPLDKMRYEISGMPIGDIIEMVAALLTKITTTNDLQHDALNRNAAHVKQAQAQAKNEDGSESSPMSSSVLAFHGKNVPAITILSYLSRIHKYCPTTYEVFLSLLVYFDRMTERVNQLVVKSEEARARADLSAARRVSMPPRARTETDADADTVMHDDASDSSDEMDSDLADDDDDEDEDDDKPQSGGVPIPREPGESSMGGSHVPIASSQATFFVVDSFNIHRLIIAGVTCASKFFSDVFYTNSRYAKVGLISFPPPLSPSDTLFGHPPDANVCPHCRLAVSHSPN